MAIDPRKRQKQLAKHRAKRKAKAASSKHSQPGPSLLGRAMATLEMEMAMRGPVDECYAADNIFDGGMGSVVVSRLSGAGHIGVGVYLIDAYCLGVKDAFVRLCTYGEFRRLLGDINQTERQKRVEASYAKKLIEDAVAYARDLGLEPHDDFKYTSRLLTDIDSSACATEFTFGYNGRPFFIAGPYDSEARVKQIMEAMARKRGAGGYEYLVPISPDTELFLSDQDYEGDDEEMEK